MTVHNMFPIEVAGEQLFAVESLGHLYVPMHTLVESTLGMHWKAQAAKLDRLASRWQVRTLTVAAASGKTTNQPSLRAHRLEAFLWSLRPGREDVRNRLARIQDGWPEALLRRYKLQDTDEAGALAARIAERVTHPLMQRIAELESDRESHYRGAAHQRWSLQKGKILQTDDFMAIADLIDEGATPTEVAAATGCSRPTVSRFVHGTLNTKAALEAYEILRSRGWVPRSSEGSHIPGAVHAA